MSFCEIAMAELLIVNEKCDCADCSESDDACEMNCDASDECIGCMEARYEREEQEFDAKCAQGID